MKGGDGEEISCAGTGQGGETQAGGVLPVPRFTADYYGLTVVDNLTGLMWTLDSRTPDPYDPNPPICAPDGRKFVWQEALNYIACLNTYNFLGYNDWRLPNRQELRSLFSDYSTYEPALPAGQHFINVEASYSYWSSTYNMTTSEDQPPIPVMNMWRGSEYFSCPDEALRFAWPVRAGQTDGNPDSAYLANLPKTGQTVSFAPGDDGDIRAGVEWPDPGFIVTYCDAKKHKADSRSRRFLDVVIRSLQKGRFYLIPLHCLFCIVLVLRHI